MDIFSGLKIYYINLDRSVDRKIFIEKELDKYKLYNERICAIDGNNLDEQIKLKKYKCFYRDGYLNNYEKACTLSHIKAIKTAYDNDDKYAIIIEDDCCFKYIRFQKKKIIDLFDDEIDLIQLMIICNPDELEYLKNEKNIINKGFKSSTGAYVISRTGMKKILDSEYIENLSEADHFLYHKLNVYHTTKPYFRDNINYGTQIRDEKDKENDKILHKKNAIFWDNYYFEMLRKKI